MLTFDHVQFRYPGGPAILRDLSFRIGRGEFVALAGANGAGKSTISRLSGGLLQPTSGRVTAARMDTKTTRASQIARKVAFLFQNPDRQLCQNTVRAEVSFGMRVQGFPEEEINARTEAALQTFSLNGDWSPFTRSRGERQRIALASVLAGKPELVILDEPTTGLNYRECTAIMDHITKLNREEGLTVLMVCHDMELIQSYAGRVLVLNGGELLGDGPVKTVMKDRALLAAARLRPAQIPDLALRLGAGFEEVYTVDEMARELIRRAGREEKAL